MTLHIHTNALNMLNYMKNPSFIIIELKNNLVVDFAEDEEEALQKCKIARSYGSECKYYESSITTIETIRDATKNVDVNHPQQGVAIEGLDLDFLINSFKQNKTN